MGDTVPIIGQPQPEISDGVPEFARANIEKIQQLDREGFKVNPLLFIEAQLDELTELVIPSDSGDYLNFQRGVEERVGQKLDQIAAAVHRAKLAL